MIATTKADIDGMRAAGSLAAKILNEVEGEVKPGISTLELDKYVDSLTEAAGATSAPYQYTLGDAPPFPGHCCTSVNHVVCHGIPSEFDILKDGDLVNIDITVKLNGYHGDTSRTFMVGHTFTLEALKLLNRTRVALLRGIEVVKPGGCISDIGRVIEEYISEFGYGIVDRLTGHGIGKNFHESPSIFHRHVPFLKRELVPGLCFTIEPMINMGTKEVDLLEDKWTIVTRDRKLSAQFEHTVMVTDDGVEILTK